MEAKKFTIYNQTQESSVSNGVTVVNSSREPLTALRVMVEGLGAGEETGLWLTQVTVIPMVPRISPFDLVYLDADHRIVVRAELLPTTEMPRFKKPASSALVLPFRTISSARIAVGDQLTFAEVVESEAAAEPTEPTPSEPQIQETLEGATPAAQSAELTIFEASEAAAELEAPFLNPFLSIEPASEPAERTAPLAIPEPDRKEGDFVLSDFLRTESAEPVVVRAQDEASAPGEVAKTPEPAAEKPAAIASRGPKRRRAKKAVAIDWSPQQASQKLEAAAEPKKPVDRFFRWLYPALYDHNRRTAERHSSEGLVAYDFAGDAPRMHEVVDLSDNGLYLRTQERWEPGTLISLTLQPAGPFEVESSLRVEFDCGVVRVGADGVGLSIVLPAGMQLKLWEAPGRNGANQSDPMCVVRELRMARALAFMRRICPSADAQITERFHKTLSNVRAYNIVEVTLRAERILAQEANAYCMVAHPDVILRILEYGSWVDEEWLQDLWAGLLASSCTFEGHDESNLVYVNLLSKLSPLPTQILTMSCAKLMMESAAASRAHLACSADEIARITRSNNLVKIYKSIGELSELGLVERNPRTASPANPGEAKAMPTQLGLEMFTRCNGQRSESMAA